MFDTLWNESEAVGGGGLLHRPDLGSKLGSRRDEKICLCRDLRWVNNS